MRCDSSFPCLEHNTTVFETRRRFSPENPPFNAELQYVVSCFFEKTPVRLRCSLCFKHWFWQKMPILVKSRWSLRWMPPSLSDHKERSCFGKKRAVRICIDSWIAHQVRHWDYVITFTVRVRFHTRPVLDSSSNIRRGMLLRFFCKTSKHARLTSRRVLVFSRGFQAQKRPLS